MFLHDRWADQRSYFRQQPVKPILGDSFFRACRRSFHPLSNLLQADLVCDGWRPDLNDDACGERGCFSPLLANGADAQQCSFVERVCRDIHRMLCPGVAGERNGTSPYIAHNGDHTSLCSPFIRLLPATRYSGRLATDLCLSVVV